jgi:hypothetical protein
MNNGRVHNARKYCRQFPEWSLRDWPIHLIRLIWKLKSMIRHNGEYFIKWLIKVLLVPSSSRNRRGEAITFCTPSINTYLGDKSWFYLVNRRCNGRSPHICCIDKRWQSPQWRIEGTTGYSGLSDVISLVLNEKWLCMIWFHSMPMEIEQTHSLREVDLFQIKRNDGQNSMIDMVRLPFVSIFRFHSAFPRFPQFKNIFFDDSVSEYVQLSKLRLSLFPSFVSQQIARY